MYPEVITRTLTLPKVLSGISKTIGIVNQAIPLYKEAKPLWNNAKTALQILKVMNKDDKPKVTNNNTQKAVIKEVAPKISTPQFFQ